MYISISFTIRFHFDDYLSFYIDLSEESSNHFKNVKFMFCLWVNYSIHSFISEFIGIVLCFDENNILSKDIIRKIGKNRAINFCQ